jgi:type IV secretory pathway VirD2 relaxase
VAKKKEPDDQAVMDGEDALRRLDVLARAIARRDDLVAALLESERRTRQLRQQVKEAGWEVASLSRGLVVAVNGRKERG